MGKIRKFTEIQIKKIIGGRDPVRIVEEFLINQKIDPDKSCKDKTSDNIRWVVSIQEGVELEILLENLKSSPESTLYMGINVATVPLRGSFEMLCSALEIADGLVGIKVSLVGYYLVLSATLAAHDMTLEDIEYYHQLIISQRKWFIDALAEDLGV
jgi:hypothetical protein